MADEPKATKEQLAYAQLLDIGMKLGMIILVITFALYVFGVFEPNIAFDDLPNEWEKSAEEYVADNGEVDGWAWVNELDKGDFLNFLGIAFLAGVSIFCYIRILPILLGKKDYIYAVLALVEVAVLVLAASGLLKVGGH
jgi:hypothetical protein